TPSRSSRRCSTSARSSSRPWSSKRGHLRKAGSQRPRGGVRARRGTSAACSRRAGGFDSGYIQPYGCTNADRPARLRPHVRRPRGRHPARHRAPRDRRPGRGVRARRALSDELRGRAKARRDPGAGGAGDQEAHRTAEGRPGQPRGAAGRPPPARPVRGAVARTDRSDDRARRRRYERERTMTVTAVHKDPEHLTMILDAEFEASPDRVWELWSDPRQLERWWGPPHYPATVTSHDLRAGGRVEYHMTGP